MAVLKESRAASVPSPADCSGTPQNSTRGTHRGIPAGTARLVGTAGAHHLESAIAVELQRGRETLQVRGPGLRAAELLHGEEQQIR